LVTSRYFFATSSFSLARQTTLAGKTPASRLGITAAELTAHV